MEYFTAICTQYLFAKMSKNSQNAVSSNAVSSRVAAFEKISQPQNAPVPPIAVSRPVQSKNFASKAAVLQKCIGGVPALQVQAQVPQAQVQVQPSSSFKFAQAQVQAQFQAPQSRDPRFEGCGPKIASVPVSNNAVRLSAPQAPAIPSVPYIPMKNAERHREGGPAVILRDSIPSVPFMPMENAERHREGGPAVILRDSIPPSQTPVPFVPSGRFMFGAASDATPTPVPVSPTPVPAHAPSAPNQCQFVYEWRADNATRHRESSPAVHLSFGAPSQKDDVPSPSTSTSFGRMLPPAVPSVPSVPPARSIPPPPPKPQPPAARPSPFAFAVPSAPPSLSLSPQPQPPSAAQPSAPCAPSISHVPSVIVPSRLYEELKREDEAHERKEKNYSAGVMCLIVPGYDSLGCPTSHVIMHTTHQKTIGFPGGSINGYKCMVTGRYTREDPLTAAKREFAEETNVRLYEVDDPENNDVFNRRKSHLISILESHDIQNRDGSWTGFYIAQLLSGEPFDTEVWKKSRTARSETMGVYAVTIKDILEYDQQPTTRLPYGSQFTPEGTRVRGCAIKSMDLLQKFLRRNGFGN